MRRIDLALGVLLAGLAASTAAATGTEDDCPAVDPFAYMRFEGYPAEQLSLQQTHFVSSDPSESRSGPDGIEHLVAVVLSSHRSQCAPVRILNVIGGADFDSRGTAFEDRVSVDRAFAAMKELKAALEPARSAAVERGEIRDLSVGFTFGGMGTRGAIHKSPTSEAERAENRLVVVHFVHAPASPTATGADLPDASPKQESSGE